MRWHGAYGRGAMRQHREDKRVQAKTRNALTSPERRRQFARDYGYSRNSARIAAGLHF